MTSFRSYAGRDFMYCWPQSFTNFTYKISTKAIGIGEPVNGRCSVRGSKTKRIRKKIVIFCSLQMQ